MSLLKRASPALGAVYWHCNGAARKGEVGCRVAAPRPMLRLRPRRRRVLGWWVNSLKDIFVIGI